MADASCTERCRAPGRPEIWCQAPHTPSLGKLNRRPHTSRDSLRPRVLPRVPCVPCPRPCPIRSAPFKAPLLTRIVKSVAKGVDFFTAFLRCKMNAITHFLNREIKKKTESEPPRRFNVYHTRHFSIYRIDMIFFLRKRGSMHMVGRG